MTFLRAGFKALVVALIASILVVVPRPDSGGDSAQAQPPEPNIVFIMTDDQDLGLMDYMPLTQSLLVDEGVTFTNGLVDLPLCCPARATTMLGQGARKHGIYTNRTPLGGYTPFIPLEDETVAVWMDRAGYDTAFFGKYVNGYPSSSLREQLHIPAGWDRWFGLWEEEQEPYTFEVNDDGVIRTGLGYNTDVMAAAASDFITESDDDPFFMMILDTAPHVPLVPAPRHEDLYPGLTAPRSPNYDEADVSDKTYYQGEEPLSKGEMANYDEESRLRVLEMQSVDEMVADVVASLDAAGKLDNTYIVFTSDNGYLLGEHRLRGKVFPYEEAINVPLIVRGPGIAPGTISDELVGNIDFAPTFTALAGGEWTIDVDGANFIGLVSDLYPTPAWREIFRVNAAFFDAARSKDDILIHFATGGREYYDLTVDPYQLDNTYDSMDPVRRAELESAITAFTADNEVPLVDAGPDQVVTTLATTVVGSVADDGLPYATDLLTLPPSFEPLEYGWSQVAGPAQAVFADAGNLSTGVTFPTAGTYQLALFGDDSTGPVTDVLTVFVRPADVRVGFIASSTSLATPDREARDVIVDAGFDVTVIDDDSDLAGLDLTTLDLLVVSSSVAPTNVGDIFKDAPVPLLTWENYLFAHLALATEKVTAATETRVTIQDTAHPIAGGLSGSPSVYGTASGLSYGTVGEAATVIASVQNDESKAVLAAYSTGDALTDNTPAAAPRVLFFADYRGPQYFTADAELLLHNSLQWMATQIGDAPDPENQAPVVDAGDDVVIEVPVLEVTLAGSVIDDGLPAGSVTAQWSQSSGPSNVSFSDATQATTTATFPGVGDYVLELAGFDGLRTTVDSVSITVREPNQTPVAILVAGSTSPPTGDRPIRDLLVAAGIDVTIVDDDSDLSAIDTSQLDLIVIASSVVPTKVGNVFRETPVPLLTWENYLFRDLGMATERLTATTHTQIVIADPTHPIADGAVGTVTVLDQANKLGWGVPAPDAHIIAHVPGEPDQPVIFSYSVGDVLLSGAPAPARRVAIFPNYTGARFLSPGGEDLISAAIAHALGRDIDPPDPVNEPPVVDAGDDVVVQLPVADVVLEGLAFDDGLPVDAALTVAWSQADGPDGVVFADAGLVATTATFPGVGVYTLELLATDGALTTTDTLTVTVAAVNDEQTAILVAGSAAPPSGDRQIRDLLIDAGLTVTIIDDDSDLTTLDTSQLDLIVIASSVVPSKVGAIFKDTPVALITWENYLFDDLAIATEGLSSGTQTEIEIADPAHPIAVGRTGSVEVYTEPNRLTWGTPAPDADIIAHVPGNEGQPVIVSYEAGDELLDGTIAAANRIAIFPDYNGARRLTSLGESIISAAIASALNLN